MQKNIEKNISKALRKSSPARAWGIIMLCAVLIVIAVFIRFFAFSVWNFDGKIIFVCEFAGCKNKSKNGDLLLIAIKNQNPVFLWQVGKSGDSIKVPTPFDTLNIKVPSIGDTIIFESLDPMLWDASFALYKEFEPQKKLKTEISLWSHEKEVPFAHVGRASISGRPVTEKEVTFLPWQELRILELQLQKIFPIYDSMHFKRKLFADSIEIESFVINEELFYLSCEKHGQQKLCYDSRENGFFKKSELQGIVF
jgi:hypothetical protein